MAQKQPSYFSQSMTIAPGDSQYVHRACDFVTCLESSGPFSMSFNDGPDSDFQAGLTYRAPQGIDRVRITNPSSSVNLVVEIAMGQGDFQDSRAAFTGALVVRQASPPVLDIPAPVDVPTGASARVLNSNLNRTQSVIQNQGDGPVYLQDNDSGNAGEGLRLDAGQSFTIQTDNPIWAHNDTGTVQRIQIAETRLT